MRWTNSSKAIENRVTAVTQLIDIREGYNQSIGLASQELDVFMIDVGTIACLFLYIV